MKKVSRVKICNALSVLLVLGFIIKTIIDYSQYKDTLNSAPFYIWVIANIFYFIIPSIAVFVVGLVMKNKAKKAR